MANNGSPAEFDIDSVNPRDPTVSAYNLSWTNLSYTVDGKEILTDLNGITYPGFVVAILGESGAGKTSLLNILAGRVIDSDHVTGSILINGSDDIPIRQVSRYCPQDEALFGNLTVYETLMYAADFSLPAKTPRAEKILVVKRLLEDFGLAKVQKTVIGTALKRGCSGGEIRRVSVASQVIGLRTGFLFLDEPTSGLDSASAEAVMQAVSTLAKNLNIVVIATIHQPSTETFEIFTHVLLLAQGRTVYYGDREEAIGYFNAISHPVPVHANPADFYLKLTSASFDLQPTEAQARLRKLADTFHFSEENKYLLAEILENHNFPPMSSGAPRIPRRNTFLTQTTVLMSRAFVNAVKNPVAYWIRVVMYVALAVLMGTTWFRMDTDQTTVNDRLSCLFFGVAFLSFMAVAGIPAFLEERLVFLRERANGLYGSLPYVISNMVVSIPFVFIITLTFSAVAYYLMGLQEFGEKFCTFATLLFVSLMIAEAQTVLISVGVPIFIGALAVCAFTNGLWMVVEGYFVQKKNIPDFWKYSFHQIDFQKYVYEILITNEFEGLTFSCNRTESDACACIIPAHNESSASPCSFTGEDVLSFYDYAQIDYTKWMVILGGIFCTLKFLTWVLLAVQTRNKVRPRKNNVYAMNNPYSVKNPDIAGTNGETGKPGYANPDFVGDEKLV